MMPLRPGLFTSLFTEIAADGQLKSKAFLTQLANAIEKQAKTNASSGSHKRGTPTPASPGSGPAVISGTLRRSITHSPVTLTGTGWETKVGTGAGIAPPYGSTPASRYGLALETGLRNGTTFPFLKPAYRFAIIVVAPQLYVSIYRPGWPRI